MAFKQPAMAFGAVLMLCGTVLAQSSTVPTTKSFRSPQEIGRDIQQATKDLRAVSMAPGDILDPSKRAIMAPKAQPILAHMDALIQEMIQVAPPLKAQLTPRRFQLLALKGLLGDAQAEATLKEASASPDPATSNAAKCAALTADWVRAAQDPVAQGKVLDRTEEVVKAAPADVNAALLLASYVQLGAASAANRDRAVKMIREDLKGPSGEQLKAQLEKAMAATRATTQPTTKAVG